jgi:hypothetical protein
MKPGSLVETSCNRDLFDVARRGEPARSDPLDHWRSYDEVALIKKLPSEARRTGCCGVVPPAPHPRREST